MRILHVYKEKNGSSHILQYVQESFADVFAKNANLITK